MVAPLKATFFAFRKREPRVLLRATAMHFVLMLLIIGLFIGFAWIFRSETNWLTVTALLLVWASAYSLVSASYETTCLRQMLRGDITGLGGLSVDGDTLRVWSGHWLWLLFAGTSFFGVILLSALIFGALRAQQVTAPWLSLVVVGAWIAILTPFGLRLCAGNAASIARRQFSYFLGASAAQGRYWALLGSYFIVWLMCVPLFVGLNVAVAFVDATILQSGGSLVAFAILTAWAIANLAFLFLAAGVNARAVIAAGEEGKIEGVATDVASVFD